MSHAYSTYETLLNDTTVNDLLILTLTIMLEKSVTDLLGHRILQRHLAFFSKKFLIIILFRFHAYAVIMEMDSYEGQPLDPKTNRANIVPEEEDVRRRSPWGGDEAWCHRYLWGVGGGAEHTGADTGPHRDGARTYNTDRYEHTGPDTGSHRDSEPIIQIGMDTLRYRPS